MTTVPQGTKIIIERSRYLFEAISKDLINLSSLARHIKPELEEMLNKKISNASIIIALKRLKTKHKPQTKYKNLFIKTPEMTIHSELTLITLISSEKIIAEYQEVLRLNQEEKRHFLSVVKGVNETTIIISSGLYKKISKILDTQEILYKKNNLSSITLQLPKETIETSGVIYFLIKSLAWEGINIAEIISTTFEFTIFIRNEDLNRSFAILKSIFES